MRMTADTLLALENIRKQYAQDLIVYHAGHVYKADPVSLLWIKSVHEAIDQDGMPTPLSQDDVVLLVEKLVEARNKARKLYFERMAKLGLDKLTEVKQEDEEGAE